MTLLVAALMASNILSPGSIEIVVPLSKIEAAGMAELMAMPMTSANHAYVMEFSTGEVTEIPEMADFYGVRSPKGYTMPKSDLRPVMLTFGVADGLERYAAVLGRIGAGMDKYNRLWVDWNRDRRFADDEMILPEEGHSRSAMGPVQCFGPVSVPPGSGKPSKICFLLENAQILKVVPKEVLAGEIAVGGRSHRLLLVDSNLDGRYEVGGVGDSLIIDRNRDGKFQGGDNAFVWGAAGYTAASEATLLQRFVQLPDGAFYTPIVEPDGAAIRFARDTGAEGRVVGLGKGSDLMLILDGGVLAAKATDGSVRLPAGTYRILGATTAVPDKAGKNWTFSVANPRSREKVELGAGQEKRLSYGLPVSLALSVDKAGKAYNIGVSLMDRSKSEIGDVRKSDGQYPAEPVLRLTDARGKLLKTEKFHYG